jgi:molybdopterin molybdotransferase
MSRFLHIVPVPEAIDAAVGMAPTPVPEEIPAEDATGRVLCTDVESRDDIPGFDRSVVDGFAVRAADTTGAGDSIPALLRFTGTVAMGRPDPRLVVSDGTCAYIPTGGVLPHGADAAVMVEHTAKTGDTVLVKRSVSPGENVLMHDEDYSRGSVIFPSGHRLTPRDAGILAACGRTSVVVAKKPVIGIISTGNELVPPKETPGPGCVRDANAPMLAAYLREYGCTPRTYGIVPDDREALDKALERASGECDMILLSGGSSKDDRDMTAQVIAGRGEVLVHGIAIAPGKPTIIGRTGKIPVFGLPGHPGSAYVVFRVIVVPVLDRMLGQKKPHVVIVRGTLGTNIPSQKGREEYARVRLVEGIAYPVFGKAGLINTLVASDGLIQIPPNCEGLEAGSTVEVILW